MPSKAKKNPKTQSRLSSPHQPPLTPTLNADSQVNEEELRLCLEEASRKFPSLIGKSAFIGAVSDVKTTISGCTIWLSPSAMVSSSLVPGSSVSVSIASSSKKSSQSHGFPLKSLANECARCYGLDTGKRLDDEAGNYFAVATVLSSSKVLKNDVLLCSSLFHTMGRPTSGTIMFVYAIHSIECEELYLELVPSENDLPKKINTPSRLNFSAVKAHVQSENEAIASPRTPSFVSKFSNAGDSTSPIFEDSVSSISKQNNQSVASFDVKGALGDESAKRLLQTCATSSLCSRLLLVGNFVNVPMFSEDFLFQVIGAKTVLVDKSNGCSSNGNRSFDPDRAEQVKQAVSVNHMTKVYLSLASNMSSEKPIQGDLPNGKFKHMGDNAGLRDYVPKLGGLSKEYLDLKDIISSSVKDALSSFGLRTTKGVLLHGPPGTGKTSLAQLCVHDVGVNLFPVNGPEIVRQYYGESEQALHEVFDSAIQAAPAVVFIDELDAIAPARKDGGEELSQRMVATLLNLMDGISRTEGLLVIAATNRPDNIEPALRRPGRFDREIEIGVPSPNQRLDILRTLLSEMDHSLSVLQIEHLATVTHGFVGADLAALCNEAALVCLRRYAKFKKATDASCHKGTSIPYRGCSDNITEKPSPLKGVTISRDNLDDAFSSVSDLPMASALVTPCMMGATSENMEIISDNGEEEHLLKVDFEDFQKARMKIRPSAMREVILEVPKVNWEDVGGQKEVKAQLMEAVEWPQKYHDAFKRIGTHPPTGVLMFGPPGCSKTLMARAVASEAGLNFLAVKGPELFSKWVGESEKAVRSLFAKARANAPSIIFFDEIDGLAVTRGKENDGVSVSDRVMSQLLVELDGLHQRVNVTVIAATNRPDKIDPALLRPGRFDRLLYVGPPNEIDREDIFSIHLRKIPCDSDVSTKELARLTDGCTGADISLICREAAVAAIEENLNASVITMKHLKTAIKQVQPSEIQSYQQLSTKFQRAVHSSDTKDECISAQCSSRYTWFPICRNFIKSFTTYLFQFPAALSYLKTGPSG